MGFKPKAKFYDATIALERKALSSDYLLNRHYLIFHNNIVYWIAI